jgi:hypothetical protein
MANTPTSTDLKNASFVNGNGRNYNTQTQISLIVDINHTNIVQFNIVNSSLTAINKDNHSYLINRITYRGKHPLKASIENKKIILVFDLQDNNNTNPSGDLVIKANVLRDGSTGGATNIKLLSLDSNKILDKTTPILLSASTIDNDNDGYIDNIKLSFSEIIQTNNNKNNGFTVSSNTVLGVSHSQGNGEYNNSQNNGSKDIYLRLKENKSFDTGIEPSVSYSENSSNKLQDSKENNISSISSFIAQDKARPIFVSASAKSIHDGADVFTVGFSEPIFKPLVLNTDISLSGGPSIAGAVLIYFNNDKNITIELNESISGTGYIQDGDNPSVNIFSTAKDKNNNKFSDKKINTPVKLEKIKPKLLSIVKLGNGGYFTISFNEAMSSFTRNNIELKYQGTDNGVTPYIYDSTLNANRKTAVLEVANFPAFTEAETRIFTFTMQNEVKDLAGNSIDINDSNVSVTLAKDSTPPSAEQFTINMNNKEMIIEFNENIAINSFHPEAILISRYKEGNISLTSSSKVSYDKKKVTITLNDDMHNLKSFLKEKEDFNISIASNSGIVDYANNACESKNIPISSDSGSFVADNIKPNLLSWDFDLDSKKMTLNFDEPMKVVNYDARDINISDSNITFTNKLTFNQNRSSAKILPDKSIEIILFGSQIINILNKNLAKDINHTFLEINSNSGFKDIKGNSVNFLSNGKAMKTKIYKVNKNKISKLNIVPNKWNHISINRPTKTKDIMASGKISHIYAYNNEIWSASSQNIDPKVGYWMKAGEHTSNILEIPSSSSTYIKGKKEDDLIRIKSKVDGVFHLIGIENNLTYEEMHTSKNSICKTMRIHHYDSATSSSLSGWDKNGSVLENSSLWVQCVK